VGLAGFGVLLRAEPAVIVGDPRAVGLGARRSTGPFWILILVVFPGGPQAWDRLGPRLAVGRCLVGRVDELGVPQALGDHLLPVGQPFRPQAGGSAVRAPVRAVTQAIVTGLGTSFVIAPVARIIAAARSGVVRGGVPGLVGLAGVRPVSPHALPRRVRSLPMTMPSHWQTDQPVTRFTAVAPAGCARPAAAAAGALMPWSNGRVSRLAVVARQVRQHPLAGRRW
jgi:hypothetical protein